MNTTKILCKYLDDEKKGYVNGEDFVCCGMIALISMLFFTIICAFIGEIVAVEVLHVGEYTETVLDAFTISNFYLGFLVLIPSIWIILVACKTIYIAYKMYVKFSKHKFIICERDK